MKKTADSGKDMLEKALRQPGLKELMEVYDNWTMTEKAHRQYLQHLRGPRIVTVSDSTSPALQRKN